MLSRSGTRGCRPFVRSMTKVFCSSKKRMCCSCFLVMVLWSSYIMYNMIMFPDNNRYVYYFQQTYGAVEHALSSDRLLKCWNEMPDAPGMYGKDVVVCPLERHRYVPAFEKQIVKQYVELDLGPTSKECRKYGKSLQWSKLGFWKLRVDNIVVRSVSSMKRSSEEYILELNCDVNREEGIVIFDEKEDLVLKNEMNVVIPKGIVRIDAKCRSKSDGKIRGNDKHYIHRMSKEEVNDIVRWKPKVSMKKPPNVIVILIDNISRPLFYRLLYPTLEGALDRIEEGGHRMYDFKRFHVIHTRSRQNQQAQFAGMRHMTPFRLDSEEFVKKGYDESLCYSSIYDNFRRNGYLTYAIQFACDPHLLEMEDYVELSRDQCELYRNGSYKGISDILGEEGVYCTSEKDNDAKDMNDNGYFYNAAHLFDSLIDFDINYRQSSNPYFTLAYVNELHNEHMSVQGFHLALRDFLMNVNLDNTILAVLADHGPTFTFRRLSRGGAIEHRLPPLFFFIPDDYVKRMGIDQNMRQNEDKLVNAYDFYKTLYQIPYVSSLKDVELSDNSKTWRQRVDDFEELDASSNLFFEKASSSRTCDSVHIDPELCICKKVEELPLNSKRAKRAEKAIRDYLIEVNLILKEQKDYPCAEVKLVRFDTIVYDRKADTLDIFAIFGPGEVSFEVWMKGDKVSHWMRVSKMNEKEVEMDNKVPMFGDLSSRICLLQE